MAEQEDDLFRLAWDHHQAGRLAEAGALCERILEATPDRPDVLYLLGVIAYQTGQPAQTVELMRRAVAIRPPQPGCHSLLGLAAMALGRAEVAEAAFREAIALDDSANPCNNLGVLLRQQGRPDDAISAFRQALARDPAYAAAHRNLGDTYQEKGEMEAAAECFRRAVEIEPGHAGALAGLGRTLKKLARPAEAVPFLQRAVELMPDDADLYCDLGDALQTLRQLPAAVDAYQRALALDPKLACAWYAAGCAQRGQKEFPAAVHSFRQALAIHPDWPAAQHNLGQALFDLGQVEEALDLFRRSARGGDPALPLVAIATVIPGSPAGDNQAIFEARRAFAASQLPPSRPPVMKTRHARPRIGYVSSFFQNHNWMKPVWGLIHHHDRQRFEIHLFSDAPLSRIQQGYRDHPEDRFHDTTALSNAALCRRIEEAGIDLLVDLNGYSTLRRLPLFTMRPSPVVAGWFNMYATTGIDGYDYLIGDDVVIPPAEERFYCEKIARVPGSYLTFEVTYPVPDVADPPCLASGVITFGSLASQYKITGEVIASWSRILQRVPGSSLLLKNGALVSPRTRDFVQDLFGQHGIPPARIRLEGPSDHYQFLETYGRIDIALDTFPYNGGTTTTEAVWQGVPLVTFAGDRWVSRTSASILLAAGLGELVGRSLEEYEAVAVSLARSPDGLLEPRRNMRSRVGVSPVCDTQGFARNMERLYSAMLAGS